MKNISCKKNPVKKSFMLSYYCFPFLVPPPCNNADIPTKENIEPQKQWRYSRIIYYMGHEYRDVQTPRLRIKSKKRKFETIIDSKSANYLKRP